jgi:hypothetical protein
MAGIKEKKAAPVLAEFLIKNYAKTIAPRKL